MKISLSMSIAITRTTPGRTLRFFTTFPARSICRLTAPPTAPHPVPPQKGSQYNKSQELCQKIPYPPHTHRLTSRHVPKRQPESRGRPAACAFWRASVGRLDFPTSHSRPPNAHAAGLPLLSSAFTPKSNICTKWGKNRNARHSKKCYNHKNNID